MNIILVDDEQDAITYFRKQIDGMADVVLLESFCDPILALNYAKGNKKPDAAIIDINMPRMDGIALAMQLRMIKPDILIMFITAEEESSANMIRVQPDAILFKPYMKSELETCLKKLTCLCQREPEPVSKPDTRLHFRTFGRFELFLDDKICSVHNRKVKELIALFVDANGGTITSEYAISRLWADREYDDRTQALYRVTLSNMRKLLQKMGVEDILIDGGREKAFDTSMYTSDLQDFLGGNMQTVQSYNGEFMTNYSWAENTVSMLDTLYYSHMKQGKGIAG